MCTIFRILRNEPNAKVNSNWPGELFGKNFYFSLQCFPIFFYYMYEGAYETVRYNKELTHCPFINRRIEEMDTDEKEVRAGKVLDIDL